VRANAILGSRPRAVKKSSMEQASGLSQKQEGIKIDGPHDLIRPIWSLIESSRLFLAGGL
jgi:hypothetical protein